MQARRRLGRAGEVGDPLAHALDRAAPLAERARSRACGEQRPQQPLGVERRPVAGGRDVERRAGRCCSSAPSRKAPNAGAPARVQRRQAAAELLLARRVEPPGSTHSSARNVVGDRDHRGHAHRARLGQPGQRGGLGRVLAGRRVRRAS